MVSVVMYSSTLSENSLNYYDQEVVSLKKQKLAFVDYCSILHYLI